MLVMFPVCGSSVNVRKTTRAAQGRIYKTQSSPTLLQKDIACGLLTCISAVSTYIFSTFPHLIG